MCPVIQADEATTLLPQNTQSPDGGPKGPPHSILFSRQANKGPINRLPVYQQRILIHLKPCNKGGRKMKRMLIATIVMFVVFVVSIPDSLAQTINGCVSTKTGALRISSTCSRSETPISWNVTGPQGPAGPAGATGATGPTGPAGVADGITIACSGAVNYAGGKDSGTYCPSLGTSDYYTLILYRFLINISSDSSNKPRCIIDFYVNDFTTSNYTPNSHDEQYTQTVWDDYYQRWVLEVLLLHPKPFNFICVQ